MPSAVTVPRPCPEPRRECQSLGERASRQRIDSERSDVAASLCRAAIYLRLQPIVTRKVARQPQEVRYRDHQPGRSYHDQGPQLRRATSLLSSLRRDKGTVCLLVLQKTGCQGPTYARRWRQIRMGAGCWRRIFGWHFPLQLRWKSHIILPQAPCIKAWIWLKLAGRAD